MKGSWLALVALLAVGCGGGSAGTVAGPGTAMPGSDVGPAGGTVASADGRATLSVPAGALSSTVRISVQATTGPVDADVVGGSVYAVAPAGMRFGQPATLSLTYDPALRPGGTSESDLRPHLLSGETWQPAEGAVDSAARRASVQVSAAGAYAVRWVAPTADCGAAENRQFDFWLGEWDFQGANSLPGTNSITRDPGGCVIRESFRDTSGAIGRSVSVWSPTEGAWFQTYVDNRSNRLVLRGSLEGRGMVLYQTPTLRNVWTAQDANRVRYFGERTADGGATWTLSFDSVYTRR